MRFQPVDRPPNLEFGYWDETIERWRNEGLPGDYRPITGSGQHDPLSRHFGLDMHWLGCIMDFNNNAPVPAFEPEVLAEDDTTITQRCEDGIVARTPRSGTSVPQFISFPVSSQGDFDQFRLRFDPNSPERSPGNWPDLVKAYASREHPLGLNINGFFGQMRNWMGLENLSFAYHDQPDLVAQMCDFWADFSVEICGRVLDEVELDFIHFWEDMAYNSGSLVSPSHFRRFISPGYRKVIECARRRGVEIFVVDSDGDIGNLIPLFLEAGVNALLPVEIAAGNNLVAIRKQFPRLRLLGGIDKRALAVGPEAIEAELRNNVAPVVSTGGYIPALDHLVPPNVSLDNYRTYVDTKGKLLGTRGGVCDKGLMGP